MSSAASSAHARVQRWTGWACDVAGVMLVAMAVLINIEILVRGTMGRSTLIADEYSGYLFVWLTLLGFAHALHGGAFLRVEALVNRLPRRWRAWTDVLNGLVGLSVALVCTYATSSLVLASLRFGTLSIQPSATPLWLPQLALPLGFGVLCLLYAGVTFSSLRRAIGATS